LPYNITIIQTTERDGPDKIGAHGVLCGKPDENKLDLGIDERILFKYILNK